MRLEGGCYCGAVLYVAEGKPVLRAQYHCRACQHIAGGAPNLFMLMPAEGFAYTKGAPKTYTPGIAANGPPKASGQQTFRRLLEMQTLIGYD